VNLLSTKFHQEKGVEGGATISNGATLNGADINSTSAYPLRY